MPRLLDFKMTIQTGDKGMEGPVMFSINNHHVPLEDVTGGCGAGEVIEGGFKVNSFAHSMTLIGPEKGEWEIKTLKVDFNCENAEPYSVTFGPVTLDDKTEVNVWQDPPLPTFDV